MAPKTTKQKPAPTLKAGQKLNQHGRAVPLSENERKYRADWTAEQCIAELKSIAEANPDQVITRNFFRVHSTISEATWNRFFGTFQEFKRQAGVMLSRHVHGLERNIAKHASKDILIKMNDEKRAYEGKYEKPTGSRWKTILIGSDIHDVSCDPFWRRMFIDAARRIQPDVICLNGDLFDLPEFSKYGQDPREWNMLERINWVHAFLSELRTVAPNSQIDLIEGNHEFRLFRHLSEQTTAMKVLLADLHQFDIAKLLGLDKFEVNLIARANLKAWTEKDIKTEIDRENWKKYFDAAIAHHFPHARNMGWPGWNGHHHRHLVWSSYNPAHGAFEWHQIGSGHSRSATYCEAERWGNGFLIAHVDDQSKKTAFEYVQLQDFAMMGGTFYTRLPEEKVRTGQNP